MNNTAQRNEYHNGFWPFIVEYLPNYYTRDDVLEDDILFRFLTGDDVCEEDLQWIERDFDNDREQVKQALIDLEIKFTREALEAYWRDKAHLY